MPRWSHHALSLCCGLNGWSSTWLTAGTTVHVFSSFSRYATLQFETPTALTLPVLSSASMLAHVLLMSQSRSTAREPSGLTGRSADDSFGTSRTGQWMRYRSR